MTRSYPLPLHLAGPARRFHVSRDARRRFGVPDELVSVRGDVMLVDHDACARIAAAVERARAPFEPPLTGADLLAGALLEEAYHLVIERHRRTVDPTAFERVRARAAERLGDRFDATLEAFVERYPPPDVASGRSTARAVLGRAVDGVSGTDVALEELLTCHLANANPALAGARPLVDDGPLRDATAYDGVLAVLRDTLSAPATAGTAEGGRVGGLLDDLLAPMRASPNDLRGQLRYVRERWGELLGGAVDGLLANLLRVLDELEEVHRERGGGAPGPGPDHGRGIVAGVDALDERFSPDAGWMPRVVMIAKNSYVWLDQLARRYGREVHRLDQVPDEALAELADRGVNGLWLIGLWERSPASRTIKVVRGQHDAVASAYALYDYAIAADLGGDAGYEHLRDAAARHGIRLASDMVPNHVGIDGRWVVEHPDWFVQVDHPPFPGYRFEGPELSTDPRVSVKIEDRYYDGSDAAVVFQRRDVATGETRFIYHGNDGTAMPWNDTAQLDYLRADVREAVIATILEVARRFPIIRFDAAMTLARRHVRRLWYPEPGSGGAIPSRSRYGALDDAAFDAAMPTEFWREVVDRVAAEAPDTLLLAEAFWMMEGYFVRNLGMHRVYNSAFMHMTKQEDGRGYRALMKETLAFDPQILKRFVNFMNNPDEDSARVQFGDGDKYFAVATLLATLPGLPMIGHGQFEGYREKYGMEFRRARLDEHPDERLLARHDHELVPLLRRRAQFAEVDRFRLYDVIGDDGAVLEDVYAYGNDVGGARSLVLVNLRYPRSDGTLRHSVPARDPDTGSQRGETLAEALGLQGGADRVVVMHDLVSGLTSLFASDELREGGLRVSLDGYGRRVWVGIEERVDHDGSLRTLMHRLRGGGVASLDDALRDLQLEGVQAAFDDLVETDAGDAAALAAAWARFVAAGPVTAGEVALEAVPSATLRRLERTVGAATLGLAWSLHLVGHAAWPREAWRDLRLGRVVARRLAASSPAAAVAALGEVASSAWSAVARDWRRRGVVPEPSAWLRDALAHDAAGPGLGVHEHAGVRWFRREAAVTLVEVTYALLRLGRAGGGPASRAAAWRRSALALIESSGYRVDAVAEATDAAAARAGARDAGRARGAATGRTERAAHGERTSAPTRVRTRRRGR